MSVDKSFFPEYEGRKQRRDAGILQITERDIFTLTWIAEQYCISFDQLRCLLGRNPKQATKTPGILSISATRNALDRWLQLALIETPRKVTTEHTSFIWLSRRGLSQLGISLPFYLPRPATAYHIYAVNTVRLHLESYGLRSLWQSPRMLTGDQIPDAELQVSAFPVIAVRVIERPITLAITLQDEVRRLVTLADRYTSLWYFTVAANVEILTTAVTRIDQERQQTNGLHPILPSITFYTLDAQAITKGTDIYQQEQKAQAPTKPKRTRKTRQE